METIVLESNDGITVLDANTLVVAVDDTGHEEYRDPNHRVFGLGGCAFMARDYGKLIDEPWSDICRKYFPLQKRPMHASEMKFDSIQIEAINNFFNANNFFRVAAVTSHNTSKEIDVGLIKIVGSALLKRIAEVSKHIKTINRVFILIEQSERIQFEITASFSGMRYQRENQQIPIELGLCPKSACVPALEVADFIIHTAGAQTRERNINPDVVRRDFEVIFRNAKSGHAGFMEITRMVDSGEA